jgi:hypothetical protein
MNANLLLNLPRSRKRNEYRVETADYFLRFFFFFGSGGGLANDRMIYPDSPV